MIKLKKKIFFIREPARFKLDPPVHNIQEQCKLSYTRRRSFLFYC